MLETDRQKVVEAIRLADLWLDEVTAFPTGVRTAQAWSRSEWVEATLPVWSKLCDPIADKAVDAMGGMLTEDPGELGGELPGELRSALQAVTGGMGGLAAWAHRRPGRDDAPDRRHDGRRPDRRGGRRAGPRGGQLHRRRPAARPGRARPRCSRPAWPSSARGCRSAADEVRIFLALREAAHHRLFAHVPWLRSRLLGAVEDYARGITVDASALRDAMPQIDPANPEALRDALAGASLFQPEDTAAAEGGAGPAGDPAGTGRGLGRHRGRDAAAPDRLPQAAALAEAIRRRRATGGPAERTFATLVGLELRPRRLREAAAMWQQLTEARGVEGRDAVWAHPDLLPTAEDFDDPEGFVAGRPELDMSAWTRRSRRSRRRRMRPSRRCSQA